MPFGSIIEGIPGPQGPQGPPGPAGGNIDADVWFDVTDYGATGNGVTDDTAAIQAAIAALPSYGVLFFPRGNYIVSSKLTVNTFNVNVIGTGAGTQIYQSANDTLFEFNYLGGSRIEDLYLGSAATSPGTALIKLNSGCSRSFLRNILMKGSYYGIHINGSLENTFENLEATGVPFFKSCPVNQYWVYGERNGGKSINGTSFFHPILNMGTNGIHITDNNAEGGIQISGGVIEGMPGIGVYFSGITEFLRIQGVHFEACQQGTVVIDSCRVGTVSEIYASYPVKITRSKNIVVNGGYISGGVNIDKHSKQIKVSNISGVVSSQGAQIAVENVNNPASQYGAASGLYTPNTHVRNIIDGDLELWSNGIPLGFGMWGANAVTQESNIVKFGKYSAKVEVAAGQAAAALRYDLSVPRYARPFKTNYRSSSYQWVLSGSGTNEYYCQQSGSVDPEITVEPFAVLENNSTMASGTFGSLSPGQWDYGDNDSLGYDTIYIRLIDNADPDSKSSGYIEAIHRMHQMTVSGWVYKPGTNGVDPRIVLYLGSSTLQTAFTIPTDEWTKITVTYNVPPGTNTLSFLFCTKYGGGSPGDVSYWDGLEIMDGGVASPIYDDSRGLAGDFRVGGRMITSTITTFSSGDATPSVSMGNIFKTANTVATTITMFDNGVAGQQIKVIFGDDNTGIDFTGTNLKGNGGADWSPASGDHMTCIFDGSNWYCDISDNTL